MIKNIRLKGKLKIGTKNPETLAAVYMGNLEEEKSEIKIRGKPPN